MYFHDNESNSVYLENVGRIDSLKDKTTCPSSHQHCSQLGELPSSLFSKYTHLQSWNHAVFTGLDLEFSTYRVSQAFHYIIKYALKMLYLMAA